MWIPEIRYAVPYDTASVIGVPLEEIPESQSGKRNGMVVGHRDWQRHYFVIKRAEWKLDDYFDFAQKRLRELGITNP